MKYFVIRLLKNRCSIVFFINILTFISCYEGLWLGNQNFVELLKWQFGGFSYDFNFENEIPINYLIFLVQLIMIIGVGSLSEIRKSGSAYNVIIRCGRRKYWMKRSCAMLIQVIVLMLSIVLPTAIFALLNNMEFISGELFCVLGGAFIKVFPLCLVSSQILITLQLLINPMMAVTIYEAVMIAILAVADRYLIIDNMFMYRSGLLMDLKELFLFPIFFMIWFVIVFFGALIVDKREFVNI